MLGLTGMGGGVASLMWAGVAATPYKLFGWGGNDWGQLALNDITTRSSPTQIGTDTDWSIVRAGQAGYWAWYLKNDGTLWGSGRGVWGINGMGYNDGPETSSPVQLPGTYKSVRVGRSTASIKTDGALWTWGENNYGELGLNSRTSYSSPRQVGTDTTWGSSDSSLTDPGANFHDMCVGRHHKIFLKTDGTLWGVGRNSDDMNLGLNDRTDRSSPTQIGTGTDWVQTSGGSHTNTAIKTNGTLWIWGHNNYGQVGNENEQPQSSPVQIGTETTWAIADSQDSVTAAIKTDGTLWSWGYGGRGALGHNQSHTTYSSPKQVGTDTNWRTISASTGMFATKTDGTAWAWGTNLWDGKLGLNNTTERSSPCQLPGTNWHNIDNGGGGTIFALQTVD